MFTSHKIVLFFAFARVDYPMTELIINAGQFKTPTILKDRVSSQFQWKKNERKLKSVMIISSYLPYDSI